MNEILNILRNDVKPAMGCTGPICVVLAAAAAREAVGGKLLSLYINVDKDTYKNSLAVVTPGTPYTGILYPSIVGALYGKSQYGLEVIKDLGDEWDKYAVEKMAENTTINIRWDQKRLGVYVEAIAETSNGTGHAIVAIEHDRIVLLEANNNIILKDEAYNPNDIEYEKKKPINKYTIRQLYDFAMNVSIDEISFLKEAVKLNMELAEAGMREGLGAGFGKGFSTIDNSICIEAKMMTAAASDARMSGKNLSAMSCGGSGNVGITASIPLAILAKRIGANEEKMLRAICLSYLLTILGKVRIGRLSPMCACAIVASVGVAAGTVVLYDGDFEAVDKSICNLLGSVGGVICDGAKPGCAIKLAMSASTAMECGMLAAKGFSIPVNNGIVRNNADETLKLVGTLASEGMLLEDELLCKAMLNNG